MDLPPGWHLSIEDRPSPAARNRLGRELGKHNRPYLRNARWQWLGVFVRETDGDIAAGLAGRTYGDWLFIHDLWVRADLRRRGIGQELLRLAEARARERGCHSAWLYTFSFQAPEFYPKFGYRELGRFDYPPDQQRFLPEAADAGGVTCQSASKLPAYARFVAESLLEGSGFEPVWDISCQVVFLVCWRFLVRMCVQVRLACSAGDSPVGVEVRAP
jgi:GNAT superfamily N-acetyltransferase